MSNKITSFFSVKEQTGNGNAKSTDPVPSVSSVQSPIKSRHQNPQSDRSLPWNRTLKSSTVLKWQKEDLVKTNASLWL